MKWLAASLVVLAFLAGCHAPKPSFNVLAPYGSSRVPPPGTSGTAVGTGMTSYNQPGAVPAASVPAKATAPTSGQRTDTSNPSQNPSLASTGPWRSVQMKSATGDGNLASSSAGNVALTSFEAPATDNASNQTAAQEQSTSGLRLGGMPVNDATQAPAPNPPATFVPAASASPISALPAPPMVSSTNTVVASGQASDQTKPASNDNASGGQSTLQWKTRY